LWKGGNPVEDFTVERTIALKENLYCRKCEGWVYCPEMNIKCRNDQGEEVECIAKGCLEKDEKGDYFECPECRARYYLLG
jgi:Pyruvate/2-oxoacid:ferredoxin oxidoreductase delta subunit